MQWNLDHPGEPVPQDLIETAARGNELREFAKKTAKLAAFAFFNEHAKPVIADIFDKAADRLANVIADRVKTERAAFEKFAEIYHDEENIPYKPSPGLLRLMARRRQLLDKEIFPTSPPRLASSLHGIYEV